MKEELFNEWVELNAISGIGDNMPQNLRVRCAHLQANQTHLTEDTASAPTCNILDQAHPVMISNYIPHT